MRASWDRTWLETATVIARRSECVRDQVGAVVVDRRNRIVATGYNGKPWIEDDRNEPARPGCMAWCPRGDGIQPKETCRAIHAEANALLWGDRREREEGTIYITRPPCAGCAKLISNSGLWRVVWLEEPEDEELAIKAAAILAEARMSVNAWDTPVEALR